MLAPNLADRDSQNSAFDDIDAEEVPSSPVNPPFFGPQPPVIQEEPEQVPAEIIPPPVSIVAVEFDNPNETPWMDAQL